MTSPNRQQAVEIAKDVLAQLEAKKLRLTQLAYVRISGRFPMAGSLQEQIDTAQANCLVCAQVAMLFSFARLYNGVTCESFLGRLAYDVILEHLSPVFGNETLMDIDDTFEEVDPSEKETVLAAICRNIIENDGQFVLPEAKDAGATP